MVWNTVESIRFNLFVVKYSIFVSVVERNHHTALIGGVQRNESSVVIPLNYRNEYAVFNNEVIESYTFNSIPNHVDVAAIHLK